MDKSPSIDPPPEPRTERGYWAHRSARSAADREAAYQSYLETSAPYFAAIAEAGDEHRDGCPECQKGTDCIRCPRPWFTSDAERRQLFDRRYQRPTPAPGMPSKTVAQIRGDHRKWTPVRDRPQVDPSAGRCLDRPVTITQTEGIAA